MRKYSSKILGCAALAVALILLTLCPGGRARAESLDGMLRVRLTRLGSPSTVTLSADCDLVADGTNYVLPAGQALTASAVKGLLTVQVGGKTVASGKSVLLTRQKSKNYGISFVAPSLSNRFCGDVLLTAAGDVVTAVMNLYVEDYLYGVVGYVMPPSSELEALKAQAVTARSYALFQKARENMEYDLTDIQDGYTFKGRSDASEYDNVVEAVNETRGMVLMDADGVICGWSTESNGGQMESAANAFGQTAGYTVVADDEYDLYNASAAKKSCRIAKNAKDLNETLKQGLVAEATRTLAQLANDEVREVRITGIVGIRAGEAAYAAPSRVLKSLEFDVKATGWNSLGNAVNADLTVTVPTFGGLENWYGLSINPEDNETVWIDDQDDAFEIIFRRSGHGVGLSQSGTQTMADSWQTAETILTHYFPGATLSTLDLVEAVSVKTDMAQMTVPAIATTRLKDRVDLYASPSADAKVTAVLAGGATLDVYAVEDGWAAVVSSGKMGYLRLQGMTGFELAGPGVTQVEGIARMRVKEKRSLLQLPSGTAEAVQELAAGEELKSTAYSTEWVQAVTSKGVTGFVPRSAIDIIEIKDDGGAVTAVPGNRIARVRGTTRVFGAIGGEKPMGTLSAGTRVKVLARNRLWAQVTDGKNTGYVSLAYLVVEQPAQPKTAAPAKKKATPKPKIDGGDFVKLSGKQRKVVYVRANTLTAYKRYATNSGKVAQLKKGQKLLMSAFNRKWAYVSAGGKGGYVLIKGLTLEAPQEKKASKKDSKAKAAAKKKAKVSKGMIRLDGMMFATVTDDLAIIYKSRSLKSEQLDWAVRGERIRVYAVNDKWAMVVHGSVKGYMPLTSLKL